MGAGSKKPSGLVGVGERNSRGVGRLSDLADSH
jgi:hypothetical protein